jgi:hypothetical protein
MGMLDERNVQPMSHDNQQATSSADQETHALADLYAVLVAKNESAKNRRRAAGKAGFTDLDADGRRRYMRDRQRERRARQRAAAETGALPLSSATIRDALADAVMLMLAAGDSRSDVILDMASRAFELPEVAAGAIRRAARKAKPRALTAQRLSRAA